MTVGPHHLNDSRRRGTAYVMVLGMAMMLTVIGFAAMKLTRINTRIVAGTNDIREADVLAFSAVEHALATISSMSAGDPPAWRQFYTSGVETTPQDLGDGTFSWIIIDEGDGNLANSASDAAQLYGIGRVGNATRVHSQRLSSMGPGLTCLQTALHAENFLHFEHTVNCDQTISTNDSVTASGATVNGDVEAVNSVSGGTYHGSTTAGVPARQMPDPNTVFDYYTTIGTQIAYTDLNKAGNDRSIYRNVLGPASNPFGGGQTNAQGVYVIDCGNGILKIQLSRIVGTLVVLNAGVVEMIDQVNWQPAVPNYPALLIQGNASVNINSSNDLDEGFNNTNFNPPGTPYAGSTDSDQTDSYPTQIEGLVYVSGNLDCTNSPVFDGAVIVGGGFSHKFGSTLTLTYQSTYLHNPPPGFAEAGPTRPVSGTWKRTSLPP